MNTAIEEAISVHRPQWEESYKKIIRNSFDRMVQKLGVSLKGIHNDWDYCCMYNASVKFNISANKKKGEQPWQTINEYYIDEEKLGMMAKRYSDECVKNWLSKINGKLGELEEAKCNYMSNGSFNIRGIREGHNIEISQQTIIKVSKRGVVFNQFPARIYLDGKFFPESKYKKFFLSK